MSNPKGYVQNLKIPRKGDPPRNPNGRGPDKLSRELKKLSNEELNEIANMVIKGDIDQLRAIVDACNPKNPNRPAELPSALKAMLASVCIKVISKGDMESLDKLLNRLIGRVKESIHVSGDGLIPAPIVNIVIPDNGRAKKIDGGS